MKPVKLDISIQKGSTFRKVLQMKQQDGTPVNLVGSLIRAKIRKSYESIVQLSLNPEIIDPLDGKFKLELSALTTENIHFACGVYDVEIEYTNGDVAQIIFGNVLVKKEATYG